MRFRTTLQQGGRTATGIQVPAEVVDALGSGKRPPVRVTINGYSYRSTVAVLGGVYMVGVSAEHRAGAGVVPAAPHREVGRHPEAGSRPLSRHGARRRRQAMPPLAREITRR